MRRINTITHDILAALWESRVLLPLPLEFPHSWLRRIKLAGRDIRQYDRAVKSLRQRGMVQFAESNGKKFVRLTKKGQLEALLSKAVGSRLPRRPDGKWRLLMFDIPESSRQKRDLLRQLLKQNGFRKLQSSVFVSPFPLHSEAVMYLKESGLIDYIRMMRVDLMDDESSLKKMFQL